MKLDSKGYDLIKEFEGFSNIPYKCSANIPTIGYGNTFYPDGRKVTLKDAQITKKQADDIFIPIVDNFATPCFPRPRSLPLQQATSSCARCAATCR